MVLCAVREEAEENPSLREHGRAVEEESGIGGRMVRTKGKKVTEASRKSGNHAGGRSNALSKAAAQDAEAQREQVTAQVSEVALRGEKQGWDGLKNLPENTGADEKAAKPNGFSQALAWEAEPEWQGECSEAEAETARGSREPENLD